MFEEISVTSISWFVKNCAAAARVSNYLSEYFTPARLYLAFSAEIFDLFHKTGKCRSISRFPQPWSFWPVFFTNFFHQIWFSKTSGCWMDELLKTSIHPYFFCVGGFSINLCVGVFYSKPYVLCARFCVRYVVRQNRQNRRTALGERGGLSVSTIWETTARKVTKHVLPAFVDFIPSLSVEGSTINIKNCLFSGFQSVSPSFTWNELYWQPASPLFLIVYCSYQMLKKIQFWFFHLAICNSNIGSCRQRKEDGRQNMALQDQEQAAFQTRCHFNNCFFSTMCFAPNRSLLAHF